MLYSPITGILQLITLWIIYMGWATMHFCQVMVFMVSAGIDLLFLMIDYNRINMVYRGSTIMLILYWLIIAYNLIALFLSYKAYSCFKNAYYE